MKTTHATDHMIIHGQEFRNADSATTRDKKGEHMKSNSIHVMERLRAIFKAEIELLMDLNGNDFEDAEFILENALDLALNDKRNDIYK